MKYTQSIIYAFILTSCVTPYDIKSTDYQESIAVEGMITDQPGPYVVTITKAVPIQDQTLKAVPVQGASITLSDDQGNSESLVEKSSGNYYTSSMQGVVGRTYTLTINTKEGESYQSLPEKLLPVGDFTNLTAEFQLNKPIDYFDQYNDNTNYVSGANPLKAVNGFNIYLDSDVLPEQENRVWWRWTGTFEISALPQFHKKVIPFALVPDPLPCSGYVVLKGAVVQTGACTCCVCWVTQYDQIPEVSNPQLVNNNKIQRQLVGFIGVNVRTFYDKYHLEVEQLSVSQVVYDFWNKVKIQRANSSNLFQTTPPKTAGNIQATTTGARPVVGYFAASASVKHVLVLQRSDVPYAISPIDTLATSCTNVYPYSTTTQPSFW